MNIPEKCKKIKVSEYKRRYYQIHKVEIDERNKKYQQTHKEEIKKLGREYNWAHREKIIKYLKAYYQNHKEEAKKYRKTYYQNHKEELDILNKKYQQNHKKEMSKYRKKCYQKHKEQRKMYGREYCQRPEVKKRKEIRFKIEPKYKLKKNISNLIRISLKRNKSGYHWETLVGYTLEDLKKHLENQFKDGMNWEKFMKGEVHIDHIIPVSAFNFSKPEHIDFKRCWALNNLQPMWAKENMEKQDKLNESFQPSLAL